MGLAGTVLEWNDRKKGSQETGTKVIGVFSKMGNKAERGPEKPEHREPKLQLSGPRRGQCYSWL